MSTPIVDMVKAYQQSETSRLHMPGHKGVPRLGCEPWDITEIKGADELYLADGIIAESERNATELFRSAHTYYATEGSSQCIRAMLFLALQAAKRPAGSRPLLLAARNAHKAFVYACALLDVDVKWLWPLTQEHLCSCPITPEGLRVALTELQEADRLPFGVYITSPDYLGNLQDIAGLSAVCDEFEVPLLVDNAHGAYLAFLEENRHPLALGATLCCDSAHKTLPVLTGGAYLQVSEKAMSSRLAPFLEEQAVRNALCLFGSTSPSYLILQSLDLCNQLLQDGYSKEIQCCAHAVAKLAKEINARRSGLVLPIDEPLKLVLCTSTVGLTGNELSTHLRTHQIESEYADAHYVVLMFTPDNSETDFTRILEAADSLPTAVGTSLSTGSLGNDDFAVLAKEQVQTCSIHDAVFAPQEQVPVQEAAGRICALPTVSCPPAIPLAISGERIGLTATRLMEANGISTVAVLKELP